jgi:hypothetical protein
MGVIGEVRCGFLQSAVFLLHAPTLTPYSAISLLHVPPPAPTKIGCGLVQCGSVRILWLDRLCR